MSGSRGLPRFFWVALVAGAAFLALFASQAVRVVRESVQVRDDGWRARAVAGGWIVGAVTPEGPATGLRPSDRIISVDGDGRAARIGPSWWIQDLPQGAHYRLDIERAGARLAFDLTAASRRDPPFRIWSVIYLCIALTGLMVAMTVAMAKPEERAVQYAFASMLLLAVFMLSTATRPIAGVRHDAIVRLLTLVFPFYLIAQFLFLESFPKPVAPAGRWLAIRRVLIWGGLALWVSRNLITFLRLMGPPRNLPIVDAMYPVVGLLQSGGIIPDLMFVALASAAMFAVLRRNYLLLPEGQDRRRIRLIAWGQGVQLAPVLVVSALSATAGVVGVSAGMTSTISFLTKLANANIIVGQLTFAYALVKHRVLGFRVFVRLGIQYVLAQNALRTAMVLPLMWLVYSVLTHSDQKVSEVLLTGFARVNLAIVIVAAVASQYRTRISDAIDRRFFRSAYDHEAILRRLVDSVKDADSIEEISRMASREIDAALQVSKVLIFYHDARAGAFSVGYSTQAELPLLAPLSEESLLMREIGKTGAVRLAEDLRTNLAPQEAAWLDRLEVEIVAPLTGIDQTVVGLLMVGRRRSEEPFTPGDNALLRLVAVQIGSVFEVLSLREKVGRQQEIQSEVLASMDARRINLVKECPLCGRCYDRGDEQCEDDGRELVLSLPVERTIDGKYRLDRLLGRGGMGAVYLANDERLGRRVAVKVIKGSSFHSMSARRRFAREAQACARLTHPNIIRVYDYGAAENQAAYLVMEYVQGRSWRAELDRLGTFEPTAAADLLDQVFEGMEAAHEAGILHRDLKPDNLMISSAAAGVRPLVKILDFGLAKVREGTFADPKSATVAGVAMGTFGYMSPEQLAAAPVDERTDVYSLGVVTLETLTGPLPAFGPSFHRAIEAEVERRLRVPARGDADVALADAVARALAVDPAARFRSVSEMRSVLIPAIRECPRLAISFSGAKPASHVGPGAYTPSVTTHVTPDHVTRLKDDGTRES